MKSGIPVDEGERRPGALLLLLGVVVAGSSWQIASRTALAEPATVRVAPVAVETRPAAVRQPVSHIDFASRLGLARPGAPVTRRVAGGWTQKPVRTVTPAPTAVASFAGAGALHPVGSQSLTVSSVQTHSAADEATATIPRQTSRTGTTTPAGRAERSSIPSTRGGWFMPEPHPAVVAEPADRLADEDDLEGDEDEDTEDEEPGEERSDTRGPSASHEAEMLVLGPAVTTRGDVSVYSITVENATDVAHAPLRLVYDPEVLELVSAQEGPFFSSDGSQTRFVSRTSGTAGILDISLSRIPPARGIDGGGVLCTVTFLAKSAGSSPVALAGSRLLDSSGQKLEFARSDADVAVK